MLTRWRLLFAALGRALDTEARLQAAEGRLLELGQQGQARETVLREEVEKWKSHRAWSDRIVKAYLDEIERHSDTVSATPRPPT